MLTLGRDLCVFFFIDTAATEIYTLSLHDALPIWRVRALLPLLLRVWLMRVRSPRALPSTVRRTRTRSRVASRPVLSRSARSEEHTSELQSRLHLVCRLLLEKKKKKNIMFALYTDF